jgi:hypothetical protein
VQTYLACINYKASPLDNISYRIEFFDDKQGQRTGVKTRYVETGIGWQFKDTLTIPLVPEPHKHGNKDGGQKAIEANSERRECSPEFVSRGDLRRRYTASGDAGRKTMCAPVPDLQTMEHLLANNRCNDATENRESGGQCRYAADLLGDRDSNRCGHGLWCHGKRDRARASEQSVGCPVRSDAHLVYPRLDLAACQYFSMRPVKLTMSVHWG